jgi:LPXTG-motif cell wall-anchored protein
MNWKEYLRPDWKKVLLFLIFVGGLFYQKLASPAFLLFSLPLTITLQNGTVIQQTPESLPQYLFLDPLLIVWIPLSYLLSCFVINKYYEMKSKQVSRETLASMPENQRIEYTKRFVSRTDLIVAEVAMIGVGMFFIFVIYATQTNPWYYLFGVLFILIGIISLIFFRKKKLL